MENFIIIILMLIAGITFRRFNVFPENSSQVLNQFVIYVSLPALILITIPKLQLSQNFAMVALTPWLALLLSVLLVLLLSHFFNWDRQTKGVLLLLVPLGNTSFLGIPMVKAFFGEDAVSYAVIYDQLGSFLALSIYGSIILVMFGKDNHSISFQGILRKVITFPPFLCLLTAFALQNIELSSLYFSVLTPLANTLVPIVMLAVGLQMQLKPESSHLIPLISGLVLKMIIVPFLIYFIFWIAGFNGKMYQVVVFESAMPPMISAGALAILDGLSPRLSASLVAYGVIVSFVVLPSLYFLIG
ncbi:MAG: AEC family transporter [Gammaproteobacteria bacterium]